MKLSGKQIGQIQDALLDAFSTRDALRMLATIELDENLDAIAGERILRVVAFNLVTWAAAEDCVLALIQGACRQNEGNATLQQLTQAADVPFAPADFTREPWLPPRPPKPGGGLLRLWPHLPPGFGPRGRARTHARPRAGDLPELQPGRYRDYAAPQGRSGGAGAAGSGNSTRG